MFKRLHLTGFIFLSLMVPVFGQAENQDFLRSTGKIYVVVAVIAVIFIMMVGFLMYLERRISKLEKLADNDTIKTN